MVLNEDTQGWVTQNRTIKINHSLRKLVRFLWSNSTSTSNYSMEISEDGFLSKNLKNYSSY